MTPISIREAREADIPALVYFVGDILRESGAQKATLFDEAFWRWEYRTPGREALVVLAEDGESIVGAFHLTPRLMRWHGEPGTMVLLQDLGVRAEYRRHGLFMKMCTFAVDEAVRRGWDMTYALPTNETSYPGFINKLGYTHVCDMPIRVSALNIGAVAASRLPLRPLWYALGAPFTYAIRALFSVRSPGEVRVIERFAAEVDALGAAFTDAAGLGCCRDSSFLNWRFIDKPGRLYQAHGLYRDDLLRAYVVTRRTRVFGLDCLLLMDFAGHPDALLPLLSGRMEAAARDAVGLAVAMGQHPLMRSLTRLGFVTVPNRINRRVVHLIVRTHTARVAGAERASWALTIADWDVF